MPILAEARSRSAPRGRLEHCVNSDAETKAGAPTPATPGCTSRAAGNRRTLNEGRGSHPGDTRSSSPSSPFRVSAQRRPGLPPRRHSRSFAIQSRKVSAQRRPGLPPRRHPRSWRGVPPARPALNEGRGSHPGDTGEWAGVLQAPWQRSTKAGAPTPATLAHKRGVSVDDLRSTKAGAPTPATPAWRWAGPSTRWSLNEGRGSHPGDTHRCGGGSQEQGHRSTKAGAPTPATRPEFFEGWGHQDHAQRRPGLPPRRHLTPARYSAWLWGAQRRPGLPPRRHATADKRPDRPNTAQRRPGLPPRRHPRAAGVSFSPAYRSTKAGAPTPATPTPGARIGGRGPRSTKAGAPTPATRPSQRIGTTSL